MIRNHSPNIAFAYEQKDLLILARSIPEVVGAICDSGMSLDDFGGYVNEYLEDEGRLDFVPYTGRTSVFHSGHSFIEFCYSKFGLKCKLCRRIHKPHEITKIALKYKMSAVNYFDPLPELASLYPKIVGNYRAYSKFGCHHPESDALRKSLRYADSNNQGVFWGGIDGVLRFNVFCKECRGRYLYRRKSAFRTKQYSAYKHLHHANYYDQIENVEVYEDILMDFIGREISREIKEPRCNAGD